MDIQEEAERDRERQKETGERGRDRERQVRTVETG